jgi:hypothetical protein
MVNLRRRSLLFLASGLALVSFFLCWLAPAPARADVGVQPVLPGGSSLQPGEETSIQMAVEVVTMNIRAATEADNALLQLATKYYGFQSYPVWYPGVAEVEADFMMKNPTSQAVSMDAWFPLASALENVDWSFNPGEIVPRIESFRVSVGGNPVDYAVSELPNPQGADKPPLPWASFPVTFPGEKETAIHVSYMLPLQPSVKGHEMAVYYILQTGAGWAGPIGQAELIVNLPYPASPETLAGMRKLYLPPMNVGQQSTGVPSGAVLDGNQARWTWKDFEPGPEDDFAAWLLQPVKWQELEAARRAVQSDPQDGQAWLGLASVYYSLSLSWNNAPLFFSPFYLPQCLEAYQKAADLLPEHPAAHAGLALLTLAQYLPEKNAPSEVIQLVQEEYQTAKELDAGNPALMKAAGASSGLLASLEKAFFAYYYNDATATVEAATQAVHHATYTAEATLRSAAFTAKAIRMACWATAGAECTATASPTATHTPNPTFTATPIPESTLTLTHSPKPTLTSTPVQPVTPQPSRITPTTTTEAKGQVQSGVIILVASAVGLVVAGYLVYQKLRGGTGRK